MKSYLICLPLFIILVSCQSRKNNSSTSCIQDKIKSFQSDCDDAKVIQYLFQDENVYVFDSGSCGADFHSNVFNNNCELLGRLGGITGNLTINGSSFQEAKELKIIWEKESL